jgi:alpha-tubulin suppressor-like RCC1 family protein
MVVGYGNHFILTSKTCYIGYKKVDHTMFYVEEDYEPYKYKRINVYGFGDNSSGQLGLGKEEFAKYPKEIDVNNKKIIKISAGYKHSLFLTDDGEIYGTGINEDGQLGLKYAKGCKKITQIMPYGCKDIIDISAGLNHSLFATKDGRVFATGANDWGQLGLGHEYSRKWLTHVPLSHIRIPVNPLKIFNNYPFK